jgi:hypothetical protein
MGVECKLKERSKKMRPLKSIKFAVLFTVLVSMAYLWCGCGMEQVMDPSEEELLGELSSANAQSEVDIAASNLLEGTVIGAPSDQSECIRQAIEEFKNSKKECNKLKGKEKRDCIKDAIETRNSAIEDCLHDQGAGE